MTKTKVLSVFAIVAVAAMMGAASIAPAYAAQKVVNEKDEGEDFIGFFPNPCGAGVVGATVAFNEFLKVWSNEKFKYHNSSQINLYAITGELVGHIPIEAINIQGDFGDLPISGNLNLGGDGECLNGTTFPASPAFHCGNTLQKDGDLIAHSVSCL